MCKEDGCKAVTGSWPRTLSMLQWVVTLMFIIPSLTTRGLLSFLSSLALCHQSQHGRQHVEVEVSGRKLTRLVSYKPTSHENALGLVFVDPGVPNAPSVGCQEGGLILGGKSCTPRCNASRRQEGCHTGATEFFSESLVSACFSQLQSAICTTWTWECCHK